jgi:hypothetical protein
MNQNKANNKNSATLAVFSAIFIITSTFLFACGNTDKNGKNTPTTVTTSTTLTTTTPTTTTVITTTTAPTNQITSKTTITTTTEKTTITTTIPTTIPQTTTPPPTQTKLITQTTAIPPVTTKNPILTQGVSSSTTEELNFYTAQGYAGPDDYYDRNKNPELNALLDKSEAMNSDQEALWFASLSIKEQSLLGGYFAWREQNALSHLGRS